MEVTEFLKFMNDRTGAVFIALAAFTNEEGEQTYGRQGISGRYEFITLIS
jgi:hypothetical protein